MYGRQGFARTVVSRKESTALIKVEMLSRNCHGETGGRIEI